MIVSTWAGCYRDSWQGLLVPEAFSHPAKFSPGLIKRIYQHCMDRGYCKLGDIVLDPFGGIGGGGIMAAIMGLKWIGVELEEKFVDLANKNFALHSWAWVIMKYPQAIIIQGDSRKLREIVGQADCCVTSPPHGVEALGHRRGGSGEKRELSGKYKQGYTQGKIVSADYGSHPAQIGNMKAGSVDMVCTSPPFGEQQTGGDKIWDKLEIHHNRIFTEKSGREHGYKKGQLGSTPSNLGNLKPGDIDAIVTSPPWENQEPSHAQGTGFQPTHDGDRKFIDSSYGTSPGQLGQTSSSTYWAACRDIYAACFDVLKPGGVIVIVVKSYVKKGRRVPLPMQTLKLLIHLGFEPLERIKASLVEEQVSNGLFGEIHEVKERKSFFRRLAEKKGSPRIDFEEVLICRKP